MSARVQISACRPAPHGDRDTALSKRNLLARTSILLTGHMGVVLLQGLQFILLARLLGAAEFGRVAAITALLTMAAPLSGLGYGNVMLMQVSRDRRAAASAYANAVVMAAGMAAVLAPVLVGVNHFIYGHDVSWPLVLMMSATELMAVRICVVSAQLYQAVDRVQHTSLVNTLVSACRLAGVAPLALMAHPSAEAWALTVMLLMACLTAGVLYKGVKNAGGFRWDGGKAWRDKKDSAHFTFGTLAKAAYTDADKVLLGVFHSPAALGAYSSAYRLVVMAFMPVRALLDGVASRFFKAGAQGGRDTFLLARKLLMFSLPYGAAVGAFLYFFAPYLPWVLGASYAGAVPALRALCVLPAIQAIHYVFSDALTGAGHQKLRTQLQFAALLAYLALGFTLIPAHGWLGAAWTCIAAESLLAVMVFAAARIKSRKEAALP